MQVGLLFKKQVWSGFKRFPEAILLSAAWACLVVYFNHHYTKPSGTPVFFLRMPFVLALGIPVFLCVRALFERLPDAKKKAKVLIYTSAGTGLLAYYLMLSEINRVSNIRFTAYTTVFLLAFTIIPYFYHKENYELYIVNLSSRLFITGLYSLVLYLGLCMMLASLRILFSAHVSANLFLDLAAATMVFAVVFFTGGVPASHHQFKAEDYPKVLKVLLLYIVIPLLITYSAILYIYFFKIIITWQWPENVVANLVLWYAIIGALVVFYIYPLQTYHQWVTTFIKYFPKIILPLLIMMFISVFKRISAYGITESRYYVLLAGVSVAAYMIYAGLKKHPKNILLTISLAVLAVLSVCGPWNSFAISKLSQNMRFERLLQKYEMIDNGVLSKPSLSLSDEDKTEIMSIIYYFQRNHKLSDLKHVPPGFTPGQIANTMGIATASRYFAHMIKDERILWDIGGFDFFAEIKTWVDNKGSDQDAVYHYNLENQSELSLFSKGELVYHRNIDEIALQIHNQHPYIDNLAPKEMTFVDENEKVKVMYVFNRIRGVQEGTGNSRITHRECYLFVRSK